MNVIFSFIVHDSKISPVNSSHVLGTPHFPTLDVVLQEMVYPEDTYDDNTSTHDTCVLLGTEKHPITTLSELVKGCAKTSVFRMRPSRGSPWHGKLTEAEMRSFLNKMSSFKTYRLSLKAAVQTALVVKRSRTKSGPTNANDVHNDLAFEGYL